MTVDGMTLLPEHDVRRTLGARAIRLTIVRPPYPAAGAGKLRVLRVKDAGGVLEIAAGYDNYHRLDG
ncbi:MAG: hypothetical protein ABR591_11760 [Candidatus Velthaea sp.]